MQVGQTITVTDASNFYNGRQGVIADVTRFGDLVILTVEVGNVSMALRANQAEAI